MWAVLFLGLGVPAGADPKPGDDGTPEYARAAELVRRLGDRRYAVRERAARQLFEMGHAAVAALRTGVRADDEEVRARSAALVPRVTAAGWKRRADAYLARPDGPHDLPLLASWDKLVGGPDPPTRKLFAEMVRTNGEFLAEVAADSARAAELAAARCEAVCDQVRSPGGQLTAEVGDLAAVLFVDALAPGRLLWSERQPAALVANPGLAGSLDAADLRPAVRRLLVRWIEAQPANSPTAGIRFADLARRKPFPEAVPVLGKLARDTTIRYLVLRLLAVEALGAAGGPEAAAALAELIPDSTAMSRLGRPDRPDVPRLGDQALAASLILHGKRVEDYGLTGTETHFGPPVGKGHITVTVYGFVGEEARWEAVRRWEAEVAAKGGGRK